MTLRKLFKNLLCLCMALVPLETFASNFQQGGSQQVGQVGTVSQGTTDPTADKIASYIQKITEREVELERYMKGDDEKVKQLENVVADLNIISEECANTLKAEQGQKAISEKAVSNPKNTPEAKKSSAQKVAASTEKIKILDSQKNAITVLIGLFNKQIADRKAMKATELKELKECKDALAAIQKKAPDVASTGATPPLGASAQPQQQQQQQQQPQFQQQNQQGQVPVGEFFSQ